MDSHESPSFALPATVPLPGELLVYDYRPHRKPADAANGGTDSSLKVLQWNVERNYEPDAILSILAAVNPDIAVIQEIDILCKRSGSRNHMMEIASKMGWKGGFVSEFVELESVVRSPRSIDNPKQSLMEPIIILVLPLGRRRAWQRHLFPIRRLLPRAGPPTPCVQLGARRDADKGTEEGEVGCGAEAQSGAIDWFRVEYDWRYTLVAEVQPPNAPLVLCYCVHLEVDFKSPSLAKSHIQRTQPHDSAHSNAIILSQVFTGIVGRVSAFSDILHDAHEHTTTHPHQLIFGDLNTMAHSVVRLSSLYAKDQYRFLSIGLTEAEWWDRNVLDWHVDDGEYNLRLWSAGFSTLRYLFAGRLGMKPGANGSKKTATTTNGANGSTTTTPIPISDHVTLSGFFSTVLRQARNPGFYDPWSPTLDITLQNPRCLSLFAAKLDWTLVRGFKCVDRWMGNDDYAASDHKYLAVCLRYDNHEELDGATEVWKLRRKECRKMWRAQGGWVSAGWKILGIGCLVFGLCGRIFDVEEALGGNFSFRKEVDALV
ncbi:hypothetical protein BC936DRAFT_149427 [Jimgerdemannia flammicorona]|uniref:Endonuclease/exonuclease/phosphatase domain-containing protein n=1 Tax=Jimgerdemannia flammicorona TaxID=994334 RepID=A0A433D0V4_9FUNG|nr:hypothetical protein BC936DRAFT_149427 [Jimgerdemannia flammicorona]